MLLTRSLPPQFLLPAWSVRQLAQASQRAPASFSSYNRHSQKSGRPSHGTGESREAITRDDSLAEQPDLKPKPHETGASRRENDFHRATPTENYPAKQTQPEEQELLTSEPLSLFDELFPEESQARIKRQRAAEKRLDKLPAFQWHSTSPTDREERQRAKRREKYGEIPERNEPPREEKAQYNPIRHRQIELQRLRGDLERRSLAPSLPSLLILNACSTNLEESDFFRLGPRGEHIEGWTSGIIKVIPARDRNTLEKLGHYFILCSNDAAARAYQDRTNTLHRLARSKKILDETGLAIPPGYLQEGEDPVKLLQGFSLVPASGTVSLRLMNKPYRPPVIRMLNEGGPAARITKESKAGEMVIFSVDIGHILQYDLEEALRDDGRRRNLHWKFAKEGGHIFKLNYIYQGENLEGPGEETGESIEAYRARKKAEYRRPSRYVISFRDRNEARRFVREWHRRPFPVKRQHNPGDEPIPIVNVEILW